MWKPDNINEVGVPRLLHAMLRVSRFVGAAPARLWRARDWRARYWRAGDCRARHWRVAVSPPRVVLQRLVAVITNILVVSAVALDVMETINQTATRTTVLKTCHSAFVILTYTLGVWTAPGRLKQVISLLTQMLKIHTSFNCESNVNKSEDNNVKLLMAYIIWNILTCGVDSVYNIINAEQTNVVILLCLYGAKYYQYLVGLMFVLQWSIVILEMKSTITLFNNDLEHQLKNTREFDIGRIHYFIHGHDQISDMIAQINQNDGPFLLLSFILLFLQLLVTPHNLITGFGVILPTVYHVIRQTNWFLCHLSQLLLLVEPCHRLRDQMDRTRSLLRKAMEVAGRRGCDPEQLEMLNLHVELRDAALSPMGVFTFARPLVASVLGCVVTYLTWFIQAKNTSGFI